MWMDGWMDGRAGRGVCREVERMNVLRGNVRERDRESALSAVFFFSFFLDESACLYASSYPIYPSIQTNPNAPALTPYKQNRDSSLIPPSIHSMIKTNALVTANKSPQTPPYPPHPSPPNQTPQSSPSTPPPPTPSRPAPSPPSSDPPDRCIPYSPHRRGRRRARSPRAGLAPGCASRLAGGRWRAG